MKKKWFKKLLPTCNVLQKDYSLGHGTINQNTSDTIQFPELNVKIYVPRHVCQHNPIPIPMDNMSKKVDHINDPSSLQINTTFRSTAYVRSPVHPCAGNLVGIGHAVVYYAR